MPRHMRALMIGAAFAVGAAGASVAADLPVKAPMMAPPPPVIYNWAGFYIGANAGYGWGESSSRVNPLPSPAVFGASPFSVRPSPEGFVGGIQIGYNWQAGSFVYGLETDFQGSTAEDTAVRAPLATVLGPVGSSRVKSELDYFGTVRGRVGFTITPPLLVYATGGFAYGDVRTSSRTTYAGGPPLLFVGSASALETGWTVGGGVEYGISNWSVKVEYLYMDLGARSYTALPVAPNPPFRLQHNVGNLEFNVVRFGVNYRF